MSLATLKNSDGCLLQSRIQSECPIGPFEGVKTMASEQVEIIVTQMRQLSPDDRLKESVNNGEESGNQPDSALGTRGKSVLEATGLIYGKYRDSGRPESTEQDFRLPEWHQTEEELDGH
jgi:hypothetical protein